MATQLHNEVIAAPPPVSRVAEFKKHLPSTKAAGAVPKKKLIRRTDRDYSQALRRGYQFAFFLMNVWLGGQFYLWVRHYETAGASAFVSRPAGVEGWLPIAGMMNFKYFLLTRTRARTASGGDVSAGDVRRDCVLVPEGFLQLALPGGHVLGISCGSWARKFSGGISICLAGSIFRCAA